MSQYGQTAKNPPWVRSGQNMAQNSGPVNQSLMANAVPSMANAAASMLQYPQVFQGQLGQQMYGAAAVGAVQYPTRALNTAAFQIGANMAKQAGGMNSGNSSGGSDSSNTPNKSQRVFTGTVTKLQDKFGFVNDDIFFQTSCCMKGSNPQVGDRVLVEAVYNANMPFKWNATRIQVLSNRVEQGGSRFNNSGNNMYNAVPPPNENSGGGNRFASGGSRFSNNDRNSGMNRNNDRGRRDIRGGKEPVDDRKRKRDDDRSLDRERDRERQRSPPTKKSKSPGRRNRSVRRPPPRYAVVIPKGRIGRPEADLIHLTKRFPNLYVPSDFFLSEAKWLETFPIRSPLSLNFPCNFHVIHKDVDSPYPNNAVLEPADLDYLYVAKVMLLSSPGLEEIFLKTGIISKDDEASKDESDDESVISSGSGSVTHVSRLVQFLVGTRGKEAMAIGGPWSPSLDGPNPGSDPGVLVKTAIRNCKALTGIDLSACTQWFRFLEVHYHRSESVHHGKVVPARVETVVLFVPDVWSASPSRSDWETITADYKAALDRRLNPPPESPEPLSDVAGDATPAAAAATDKADDKDGDTSKDEEAMEEGEKEDEPKKDPTHYSQLDPKSMKVSELRDELEARGLSPKGLKSQLVARLAKAIKTEADEEEANGNVKDDPEAALEETEKEKPKDDRPVSPTPSSTSKKDEKAEDKKKDEDKEKDKKKKVELSERDKLHLEKRYRLPENPHIIVHPNRSHKSGKYDCTVTSLSSLLAYRVEDSKEHSFEVSLFAEAFNEMLMRDFGFTVYKTVVDAPAKQEEKKEEKKKDEDKDKDKKKDKDSANEKKKEEEKEKDDKEDASTEDVDGEEKSTTEDEKKKEDKKPKIIDNNVMLAFSYFDTTRCGYIYDKDLCELLYALGLALSRSQVKRLVQKVSVRDSVHYKKLAEKLKPEDDEEPMVTDDEEQWKELIGGNKRLLAVESKPEITSPTKKRGAAKDAASNLQSGFVMHNGALVDIAKLLGQLNKSENAKMETERALVKLKNDFAKMKEQSVKSERTIEDLQQGITKYKHKWYSTYADLNTAQENEKMYYGVISKIYSKVAPIVEKKEEQSKVPVIELPDDDKVKDEKEDEPKTVKDEEKPVEEEGKTESAEAAKGSDKPEAPEEKAQAETN